MFATTAPKAEEDAKFDGVFVRQDQRPLSGARSHARLQTAMDGGAAPSAPPRACSRRGRSITSSDETIRGHVSCSFPGARPERRSWKTASPPRRAGRRGAAAPGASWPDILADLESLTETEVEQDGKRFLLRFGAGPPPASPARRRRRPCRPPSPARSDLNSHKSFRNVSATAPFQRRFSCLAQCLKIRTVEDQSRGRRCPIAAVVATSGMRLQCLRCSQPIPQCTTDVLGDRARR